MLRSRRKFQIQLSQPEQCLESSETSFGSRELSHSKSNWQSTKRLSFSPCFILPKHGQHILALHKSQIPFIWSVWKLWQKGPDHIWTMESATGRDDHHLCHDHHSTAVMVPATCWGCQTTTYQWSFNCKMVSGKQDSSWPHMPSRLPEGSTQNVQCWLLELEVTHIGQHDAG